MVYLLNWYKKTSLNKLKKSSLPIKPGSLNRRLQQVIKIMKDNFTNFHTTHEMRLKQYVREFTVQLHARFCLKTKQANPLPWPAARHLALKLWNATLTRAQTRTNSVLLRKAAALALLLGTATGARWGDLHRLRWDDIKKVSPVGQTQLLSWNLDQSGGKKNTFKSTYGIQKTTQSVRSLNVYTIRQRPMEERLKCPIYWLQQYFKYRNRPQPRVYFFLSWRHPNRRVRHNESH